MYGDFPDDAYFIQIDEDEAYICLGSIKIDENMDLSNIVLNAQKVGIHDDEELTLSLHGSEDDDFELATSTTYSYDDFSITSSHWAGTVNFSFDRIPLSNELTYFIKIKATNYTYIDDERYIAFQLDWPEPSNNNTDEEHPAAMMGIYGYFN
jgi:hypothetical protein